MRRLAGAEVDLRPVGGAFASLTIGSSAPLALRTWYCSSSAAAVTTGSGSSGMTMVTAGLPPVTTSKRGGMDSTDRQQKCNSAAAEGLQHGGESLGKRGDASAEPRAWCKPALVGQALLPVSPLSRQECRSYRAGRPPTVVLAPFATGP